MSSQTTIAALSTPPGKGGIAVIRISGGEAFAIAGSLFRHRKPFSEIESHTVSYGRIIDRKQEPVDQVLLLKMQAPGTYTREDMVEIHCHGSPAVVKTILGLLYEMGAVPAQPGEFTMRAFLNGRMDLSQAEAVMDLIQSETGQSGKAAVFQMEGAVGQRVNKAREHIIDLLAHIQASIDYPEEDIEELTAGNIQETIREILHSLQETIGGYRQGRLLREGLHVAIYGPPNAGKSTLINLAAGEERAIVTHMPGTTRDVIEVHADLRGIPVVFHDTAGIRKTKNVVEKIGIDRTMKALNRADVAILVIDAKKGMDRDTADIIRTIRKDHVIHVINKIDLAKPDRTEEQLRQCGIFDPVRACFIRGTGVEEIFNRIFRFVEMEQVEIRNILLTNARHKHHAEQAMKFLRHAEKEAGKGIFPDLLSVDLVGAADELGSITGETASEDVIQRIFKKFCVGK